MTQKESASMASSSRADISMIQGHSAFFTMTAQSAPAPDGGPVGVVISEITHQGKLNVRCDKSYHKILSKLAGLETALAPNRFNATTSRAAVWLSPDEVLLLTEPGAETALAIQAKQGAKNTHVAINDITDAMTSLHLKGPAVRDMLAKGCAIDLHKDHFKAGHCAQTALSHAGVTILALGDDEMILLCRTSFTDYTVAYLCDAALEYGFTLKA